MREFAESIDPRVVGLFIATVSGVCGWIAGVLSRFASTWLTDRRREQDERELVLNCLNTAWPMPLTLKSGAAYKPAKLADLTRLSVAKTRRHLVVLEKENKVAAIGGSDGWFRLPPGNEREAREYLEAQRSGPLVA